MAKSSMSDMAKLLVRIDSPEAAPPTPRSCAEDASAEAEPVTARVGALSEESPCGNGGGTKVWEAVVSGDGIGVGVGIPWRGLLMVSIGVDETREKREI